MLLHKCVQIRASVQLNNFHLTFIFVLFVIHN